jgi:ATP adenylyltransferase
MPEFPANLWAPWRMEYIAGLSGTEKSKDPGCFLCEHFASRDDARNFVLSRTDKSFTVLNRFPYTSGHLLIAPAQHAAGPEDFADDVLLELMRGVRDAKRVLQRALNAEGFNIGMNLGHCAGAGLPGHLHIHVVPRWAGDTNFMSVVGEARVIPEALERVYKQYVETARALGL